MPWKSRIRPPRLLAAFAPVALALLFAYALSAQSNPPPTPGPVLAFAGQTVQVQGLTAGGTVIWFGVESTVVEYAVAQSIVAQTGTADATGQAVLTLADPVAPYSIWIAVDLKTGAFVAAAPSAAFPLQQASLDPSARETGNDPAHDFIRDGGDLVDVLLVRPGKGAWIKALGRGGQDDESDPSDPKLKLRLGHMDALFHGGGPAPDQASPKDLLFVVHLRSMDLGTLVVGGQP